VTDSHTDAERSDVVDRAERDFVASWWEVAGAGGLERHDDNGIRWFHTGLSAPHANAVVSTAATEDEADDAIDRVLGELRSRGVPFVWWTTPASRPADVAARLTDRGMRPLDTWPCLAVVPRDIGRAAPVAGLEVRRVSDDASLRAYLDIVTPILMPAGFDVLFEASVRGIGLHEGAAMTHFLGLLDGSPVATSALLTSTDVAGIYNVATIEAARGRGIGAAMTVAAVDAGAATGRDLAALEASTMGRPIYERLGFRHVADFVSYADPSAAG